VELAKTQNWLVDATKGNVGCSKKEDPQMTLALKVESFRMGSVLLWKDRGWLTLPENLWALQCS
jgi:hypothetical protein